jgi:solute carrier family 25 protein 33/36
LNLFRNLRAIDLIRNVYREHGIRGFYKGISASYVGVSETIVHFVIYEHVKAQLQSFQTLHNRSPDDAGLYNFLSYLCAAACSKSVATTLCYPHEVVRTRLREEGTKYRTFMQTLKTVYYEESIAGLYRGLLTHLIRQIPVKYFVLFIFFLLSIFLDIEHSDYDEYI